MAFRNEEDTKPQLEISFTSLSVLSYEELNLLQEAEINSEKKDLDTIEAGSLYDLRMGSIMKKKCGTCKQDVMCPGHLGIIRLKEGNHIFNPMFMDALARVLTIFCNDCGKLILSAEDIRREGIESQRDLTRLKSMAELSKPAKYSSCPSQSQHCRPNPVYKVEKDNYLLVAYPSANKKEDKVLITPQHALKLLSKLSPADLKLLGLHGDESNLNLGFARGSNPINWIMRAIPVIPSAARPFTIVDGQITHSFITEAYSNIIKDNNKFEEAPAKIWAEYNRMIKGGKSKGWGNEKEDSIKESLSSKEGYIRGNVMGKRVDFCARTVLGSAPECDFGELMVPRKYESILTTPVTVTGRNLQYVQQLNLANKITRYIRGNMRHEIKPINTVKYEPRIGDVVERWMENGDDALFNRQPSLHMQSMMGVKVKFWEYLTFGLHSSYTTPYNADFDGDEGSVHKLQTPGAIIEGSEIAGIPKCVMNAQNNSPIMGIVYNGVSAGFIMTDDDTILDEEDFIEATEVLLEPPGNTFRQRLAKHGINPFSGKALFSTLLPSDFFYTSGDVKIRDGILISGQITKKHIGPTGRSIIHFLWKMYSKQQVTQFFTECQRLCDWFIVYYGFTIGYEDCRAPNQKQLDTIIRHAVAKAKVDIAGLPLPKDALPIERERLEIQRQTILNQTEAIGVKIQQQLPKTNPLRIMADSGAKGNAVNTAQIVGILGQQFIRGELPAMTLSGGTRCLPYFMPGDDSIEARGFVQHNFMEGVNLPEFIFHIQSSRIGLIDTAVRTAESGHMHRLLVKTLEDITTQYDGSMRNNDHIIFQFSYSDGFDAGELLPIPGSDPNFIDIKLIVDRLNYMRESREEEKE